MPITLKERVVSQPGDAIHRTRAEVPEYLKRAIAESVQQGKADARATAAGASVYVPPRRRRR